MELFKERGQNLTAFRGETWPQSQILGRQKQEKKARGGREWGDTVKSLSLGMWNWDEGRVRCHSGQALLYFSSRVGYKPTWERRKWEDAQPIPGDSLVPATLLSLALLVLWLEVQATPMAVASELRPS